MQVQVSTQHDFNGSFVFIGWFAKATVLFSFPISTYIVHKSTGNSHFLHPKLILVKLVHIRDSTINAYYFDYFRIH